ncbi:MAG TPA: hypothetical protein VF541_07530 [Longimicrobium sp.]|jgi:TRAP-type C4-dicarboxylate transport system permease small subunit
MRVITLLLALSGAALLAFGYWGIYTPAGQRRFDEMAGIIPFWAALLGGFLLCVAALLALVGWLRRRRVR